MISEFLFKPLYDKQHRFIEVTDVRKGKVKKSQKGWRDRLLCSSCEAKLNRFEKHSRRLFTDPLPPHMPGSKMAREFARVDYKLLKLFFLSILWRASVSKLDMFRHVSLGVHEEKMKQLLVNEDAGDALCYPVIFFNLHFEGKHFQDFMVEPTPMKLKGRTCYRFILRGFLVLMFVSRQPPAGKMRHYVLSPWKSVRGYDSEFCEWAFLTEVWNRTAETTKDVVI